MPTKYHIIQSNSFNQVTESGGSVIDASPAIDWSIGLPFVWVRAHAERKGWKVVPITETCLDVRTIEVDGDVYEFFHDGSHIRQIMKNDHEISWSELPAMLKGLLQ